MGKPKENGTLIMFPKSDPCPNLEVAEVTIQTLKKQLESVIKTLRRVQKENASMKKQLAEQHVPKLNELA